MDKGKRKKLLTVLFVLLNAAVIAVTAYDEFKDDERIAFSLGEKGGRWLLFALLCLFAAFAAETAKYVLMMRSLHEKVSVRNAFCTAAVGKYYDSVTPTGAGGQPFQILWLRRHGYPPASASAMPIAGFLTMQGAFIAAALLIFILRREVEIEALRHTAYVGLVFISFLPCLLLAFSLLPKQTSSLIKGAVRSAARLRLVREPEEQTGKILAILTEYHEGFRKLSGKGTLLAELFLLSLLYRFGLLCIPYCLLRAMGGTSSAIHVITMMVYISAAVAVMPTPGHSGAAEGAFYLVFMDLATDGVFWAMLLWRVLTYYSFIAVGAVVYGTSAVHKRRGKRAKKNV